MKVLNDKLAKGKRTREHRTTDINNNVITGFTALHYACYCGYIEEVKLLMELEYDMRTEETVSIPALGFTNTGKYKLPAGSNCLTIALLRKRGDIVTYILEYLEKNKDAREELVGKMDDMGLTSLLMACICNFPEAMAVIRHGIFMNAEFFLIKTGDITPTTNCALFGRPELAKYFVELANV